MRGLEVCASWYLVFVLELQVIEVVVYWVGVVVNDPSSSSSKININKHTISVTTIPFNILIRNINQEVQPQKLSL